MKYWLAGTWLGCATHQAVMMLILLHDRHPDAFKVVLLAGYAITYVYLTYKSIKTLKGFYDEA
jgi:hypothetical protein